MREIHLHLEDKEHYLIYITVHKEDGGITQSHSFFIKRAQAGDTKKKSPIQLKYLVSKQLLHINYVLKSLLKKKPKIYQINILNHMRLAPFHVYYKLKGKKTHKNQWFKFLYVKKKKNVVA